MTIKGARHSRNYGHHAGLILTGLFLGLWAAGLLLMWAEAGAHARIPVIPDRDVCHNMRGLQTENQLRLGWVVLDTSTPRRHDCLNGWGE